MMYRIVLVQLLFIQVAWSAAGREARALSPPRQTGASETSVTVSWDAPEIPDVQSSSYFYKLKYCRADSLHQNGWADSGEEIWEVVQDHITSTSLEVVGLEPGTSYFFKVKCHFPHDRWGPYSEPGSGTTNFASMKSESEVPGKPGVPIVADETSTYILLAWSAPEDNGDPIDSYSVYVKSLLSDSWYLGKNNVQGTSVKIGGLKPAVDYIFAVKAHNSKGWGSSSDASAPYRLLADSTVPVAPGIPNSVSSSSSSITITWTPPKAMGMPSPDRYKIKYRLADDTGDTSWRSPGHNYDKTTVEVTGLEPNTAYIFIVKAHNEVGWGPYSGESQVLSTSAPVAQKTVPAAPGVPRVDQITTNSAVLSWDAPNGFGNPVERYKIKYKVAFDPLAQWTSTHRNIVETNFKLTNLLADTQYVAIVKAHNAVGWGPYSGESVAFQTKSDGVQQPPDAPNPPKFISNTESSITMSYSAPEDHGSPVDRFKIKYHSVDNRQAMFEQWITASDQISDTSYTVKGLQANTAYVFIVKAHNSGHWGPYSASSESMRTAAIVNDKESHAVPEAPRAPTAVLTSSRAITLSWDKPDGHADGVDRYKVKYRHAYAGAPNQQWQTAGHKFTSTNTVVGDLTPGMQYVFIVKAHNNVGWGPYSPPSAPVLVASENANPKPLPPNIPALYTEPGQSGAIVSATAIAVQWTVPVDERRDRQPVDRFKVEYRAVESPVWLTATSDAVTMHWEVDGLLPDTQYVFRVSAHSDEGWSDPSKESVPFHTASYFESPPSTPDTPIVEGSTPTSVLLRWQPVSGNGISVDRYLVEYIEAYSSNAVFRLASDSIRETEYEVRSLTPDTEYFFRIAAHNSVGWSQKSSMSKITRTAVAAARTVPEVTNPPRPTADIGPTWITITWIPPATCVDDICLVDRYKVKYHAVGVDVWKTADSHIAGDSYKVEGLQPDMEYVFIVKAHNRVGWGAYSDESEPIATQAELSHSSEEGESVVDVGHMCHLSKLPSSADDSNSGEFVPQTADGFFRMSSSRFEFPTSGARDSDSFSFKVTQPSVFRATARSDPLVGDLWLQVINPDNARDDHHSNKGDLVDTGIISLEPSVQPYQLVIHYRPSLQMTNRPSRCPDFQIAVSMRSQAALLDLIRAPLSEAKELDIPREVTLAPQQQVHKFSNHYSLPVEAFAAKYGRLQYGIKLDLQCQAFVSAQIGYNLLTDDFALVLHSDEDDIMVATSLPAFSSPAVEEIDHFHVLTAVVPKGSYTLLLKGSDYVSDFREFAHLLMIDLNVVATDDEEDTSRVLAVVPPSAEDMGVNDKLELHVVFSKPVMSPDWVELHETLMARSAVSLQPLGGGQEMTPDMCEYVGGQGQAVLWTQFHGPFVAGETYKLVIQASEFGDDTGTHFRDEPGTVPREHLFKIATKKKARVVVIPTPGSGSSQPTVIRGTPSPTSQRSSPPSSSHHHDNDDGLPKNEEPPAPLPTAPQDDTPTTSSGGWASNLLVILVFVLALVLVVAVVAIRRSRQLYQQYRRVDDDGDEMHDMESLLDDL